MGVKDGLVSDGPAYRPALMNKKMMCHYISVTERQLDRMRVQGLPSARMPGSVLITFEPDAVVAWVKANWEVVELVRGEDVSAGEARSDLRRSLGLEVV